MGILQIVATVVAFAVTAIAITLFARAGMSMLSIVRLGAADKTRSGDRGKRLGNMLRETVGHTRMLRWTRVGAAHWFVFVAFIGLFPLLVQAYLEVINPAWELPWVGDWAPWVLVSELIGALGGLGIIALFVIRMFNQPSRKKVAPPPDDAEKSKAPSRQSGSRFERSRQWQAFYIEATIFGIIASHFTSRSTKIAAGELDTPVWAAPVSHLLSGAFSGLSTAGAGTIVTVAGVFEIMISWAFFWVLAKNLTMGIGWHRITAFFNIYFKREADGGPALGALKPATVRGEPIDFETADPETDPFGVGQVEHFGWKGLLDFTTCTECGRCQSQCPAWNTDKPLSPKLLIMNLREHAYAKAPYLLAGGGKDALGEETATPEQLANVPADALAEAAKTLVGDVIDPDVLWSCTTCGACVEQCPVDIEHVDHIVDMRRHQVMIESSFPAEAQTLMRNLENKGNPWGAAPNTRADWTKGLDFEVPTVDTADTEWDYLFWVGCAGAFDDKAVKTTRAVATLLHEAGVKFAILGTGETCTGDPARRSGNEFLFSMLAEQNVETLNAAGVTKIVATCPHCLNTLGNEYGQLGGHYEVVHHTQLLADLVASGKLTPVSKLDGGLTYHDPCYLGRHNRVFAPPREVLGSVAAEGLTEMPRNSERSFCCGAGGARMWMEEKLGTRININRSTEAVETGASTVAVGCPFCSTMINDGVNAVGKGDDVEVIDVAQVLLRSVRPE
ncbi:MAG TPA: (Fe-S)-binding protein [Stackebrandtia sp.]|jgi:Fe-S oxidoreductase|uniref:(Fe-S)-binding protein n=1 Tax=Stackebrandtia sp. TaxID=2023065 RepID=UPI002D6C8BFF|nr:(Fe-S)-binding protein [Stackebrandtia sp.]HZE41213.1 (Fe-S)-binding protein [Stackebrandtia sp.]